MTVLMRIEESNVEDGDDGTDENGKDSDGEVGTGDNGKNNDGDDSRDSDESTDDDEKDSDGEDKGEFLHPLVEVEAEEYSGQSGDSVA